MKFPFENFDPTDYLAQVPRETILTAQSRKKKIKTENSQTFPPQTIKHNHVDHNDKSVHVDHNNKSVHMDYNDKSIHKDHNDKSVHMDHNDKSIHVNHSDKSIHVDHNDKSVHMDHNDKSFHMDHNDNCAPEVELSNQNDQSVPSQTKIDNNLFSNSCDCIPNYNGIDINKDTLDMDMFSGLKDFHQHRLSNSAPFSLKYRLYALAVSIYLFFQLPPK